MTLQDRADQIAALMEEKRGLGGKGLAAKVRRAGRSLPRWVRREVARLLEASELEAHPKLSRQADHARALRGAQNVQKWLEQQNPWDRRKAWAIGFAATNLFNLLFIAAVVIVVLVWRGFL